jgi:hypothetical protein
VPPTRTFTPRWNRSLAAGSAFLVTIGVANGVRAWLASDWSARTTLLVTLSLALAAAGLWLARGMSWPWSGPAVVLSDAGLTLWPKRRNAPTIAWSEIAGIRVDETNRRVLFDLVTPARHRARLGPFASSPHCPVEVRNDAGEDFLGVLSEYWPAATRS